MRNQMEINLEILFKQLKFANECMDLLNKIGNTNLLNKKERLCLNDLLKGTQSIIDNIDKKLINFDGTI